MDDSTIEICITAAFSASFLVSEAGGETVANEVESFMQALKQPHDFDLDEEEVWECFEDAPEIDENDHVSRVAAAARLSEDLRREILDIAIDVAVADGDIRIHEWPSWRAHHKRPHSSLGYSPPAPGSTI